MSFEAYSVAIKLRLIDEVSMGLISMAGKFAAFNSHVGQTQAQLTKLQGQLHNLKTMGLIGGGLLTAGIEGLGFLGGPIKAAREYELAFSKLKTLNLGDAVNAQADKFARANKTMNVSATELMTTLAESVGLFGSYAEAQKHAGQLAQLNVANSAIFGGKIEGLDEGATRSLTKFMDRRGALGGDENKYQAALNLAEKIVTGSGGFTQFKDLGAFSQMGGTAFRNLSDEGILNLALVLQEQGGARAGTALMSAYQNLVGGRTPVKTMSMLAQMGLGTVGEVTSGTVGGKMSTSTVLKDIKDSALFQSNPAEWYRTTFLGALAAHGVTDEADILKWTNLLLSNRNASGQASILDTQTIQAIRDANLAKNAQGADQVIKQYNQDPNQKWTDLSAKYKNMLVELGEAALPLVTKAMGYLLTAVKGITSFAHNFPTTTKWILGIGAALGGLAVIGGTLTLFVAGISGLALIPGIATLGGVLVSAAAGLAAIAVPLIALAGVAASSYAVTSWLDKKFHWSEKLGALYSGQDDYNPNNPADKGKYIYHGKGGSGTTVHTQINLDGRTVADVVSNHQALAFKPVGGEAFDPTMTLPSVGLNY